MSASDRTFSFLFLLGVLLLMISPHAAAVASSATFFVDPDGSDSNPGSETLPFRTISYGVSRLAPGETLLVKGVVLLKSMSPFEGLRCRHLTVGGRSWPRASSGRG